MSSEYRLTRARPLDTLQIARLERGLFPEPLSLSALLRLSFSPGTHYIVARQGRLVAGWIGFQRLGPAAHTISMGVHPAHRRKGLATRLQLAADRVAVATGARWFTGEVRISNRVQLEFLEGLGWQQIGTCARFFGNGEDAVVVWNWL